MKVRMSAYTVTGPARQENQDALVMPGCILHGEASGLSRCWEVSAGGRLSCGVVDGMGGYAGGRQAALLAASELSGFCLHDAEQVNAQVTGLSDAIWKAGAAWSMPDMGAAFAMLSLFHTSEDDEESGAAVDFDDPCSGVALVANVGDVRAYAVFDGYLGLLSVDDRLPGGMGGITQSLGGANVAIDAHFYEVGLSGNDRFLLCSDGVWGLLGDDELERICSGHPSIEAGEQAVADIIELCSASAKDNCSVLLVDVLSNSAIER